VARRHGSHLESDGGVEREQLEDGVSDAKHAQNDAKDLHGALRSRPAGRGAGGQKLRSASAAVSWGFTLRWLRRFRWRRQAVTVGAERLSLHQIATPM